MIPALPYKGLQAGMFARNIFEKDFQPLAESQWRS
jgi:hypothetical protein